MQQARMTLDEIGLKFGTDKSSMHHNYLNFYERVFAPHRDETLKLVEIGILNGASLKTWERYFERGTIIGADIVPDTRRFAGGRVSVDLLDQSNVEELVGFGMKHGPFDIIIEDGSHMWEHQITTLRTLFPFLRNGGTYIVEDLQTNYGGLGPHYQGNASITCVEYLKKAVDYRVADDQLDVEKEEDAFLRTYARSMNFTFYRRACLIEKIYQPVVRESAIDPGAPLAPAEGALPVSVFAHIGKAGEVFSHTGSVRSPGDGNIQGFVLHVADDVRDALEYKARLDDGSWTEWVQADTFVGTKGRSQDLTGFSVRLLNSQGGASGVRAVGAFRGAAGAVVVGSDEECVSANGAGQLQGMQVILLPRP